MTDTIDRKLRGSVIKLSFQSLSMSCTLHRGFLGGGAQIRYLLPDVRHAPAYGLTEGQKRDT